MKSICYQMLNVIKLIRRLVDEEMKALGISRTGWQVLFRLRQLGPCTQKELVRVMDIDAGQLARVLEEFEEKDYIVRRPHKNDRRCLAIEMTEKGRAYLMPHVERSIAKEEAVLGKNFTETEKQLLSNLLTKLEKNLEDYDV